MWLQQKQRLRRLQQQQFHESTNLKRKRMVSNIIILCIFSLCAVFQVLCPLKTDNNNKFVMSLNLRQIYDWAVLQCKM